MAHATSALPFLIIAAISSVAACGGVPIDEEPGPSAPSPAPTSDSPTAPPGPPPSTTPVAPAQAIGDAFACGKPSTAGLLRQGSALQRHDLDPTRFPEARCNDGTPAVLYFRPFTGEANRHRWVIQLQGGGGCSSGQTCAERWCSTTSNFGTTHMSSKDAPKAGIVDEGILSRRAENPMGDWNHVFVRYCTSDNWSGTVTGVTVEANDPVTSAPTTYRIDFRGAAVFDATIALLRQDGGPALEYSAGGTKVALPDLDQATDVVLAGASAGSGGVVNNLDRLADTLKPGATKVWGLHDSGTHPDQAALDWSTTPMCTKDKLCDYETFFKTDVASGANALQKRRNDASCLAWYAANDPSTAWQCADNAHVLRHHLTTPVFIRMGQRDQLISGNYIEAKYTVPGAGLMDDNRFAALVRVRATEMTTRSAAHEPAVAPFGAFINSCSKHETLSNDPSVFGAWIMSGGQQVSFLDAFESWRTGASVPVLVTQPGGADSCTP